MKKTLFALLIVLGTRSFVLAQSPRNLSIGPMVGLNVSNLYGDISDTRAKAGLAAGLFFNYSIKRTFGISGQVLYSQMGAKRKNTSIGLDNKIALNYIQVPILATFYFGNGLKPGAIRPKLFVGPQVGFLLSAKDKDGNKLLNNGENAYTPVDLGVAFGGGLNYALGNQSWINFDVRYGLGLADIARTPNVAIRNGAFTALLGVSFPLGNYDKSSRQIYR